MNWRTISASTLLAASLLAPMSSIAAPLKDGSRVVNSQVVSQYRRNGNGRIRNQGQRWRRMQEELQLTPRQIRRIQQIRRSSGQDRQSMRQDIWRVLTPTQREKMKNLRKQRQYRRSSNFNGKNF